MGRGVYIIRREGEVRVATAASALDSSDRRRRRRRAARRRFLGALSFFPPSLGWFARPVAVYFGPFNLCRRIPAFAGAYTISKETAENAASTNATPSRE